MVPQTFFNDLMHGYHNPELRIELRRRNKEAETDGPFAGRHTWRSEWYPLTTPALDAAYKTAINWQRHGDVFFGVLPRLGRTRLDELVPEADALWVEIDGGKTGQAGAHAFLRTAIDRGTYSPHIVIGSGGGVHAYWHLAQPYDGADIRESMTTLLKRLCFSLGGQVWKGDGSYNLTRADPDAPFADPVSTNVGRILRVPGTWNWKGTRNCPVTLLDHHPRAARLTLSQWDEYLPAAPRYRPVERRPRPAAARGTTLPRSTQEALDDCYAPSERYPALRSILCSARHCGWSEAGMMNLCYDFATRNPGCDEQVFQMLVRDTVRRVHEDL